MKSDMRSTVSPNCLCFLSWLTKGRLGILTAILALVLAGANTQVQGAEAVAGSTNLPPASEIIAKHLKVMGGKDAILKHTSSTFKGTFAIPAQGITGPILIHAAKPNKLVLRITIPGLGEVKSGYNGEVGWSMDPAMGPMLMEGKRLEQLKEQADYYAVLHDPKSFKSLETVEKTTFEGKDAYKVKLVRPTGQETFEFYDVKTGFLIGSTSVQESPLGAVPVTSVFSEYKPFGGVLLSTKMSQKVMNIEQVVTVDTVEFDKVQDSEFALPDQIKGMVKK